uniref:Uncharacterized protein n=1 Tax=Physcomitrium patens TaxID=3218 RepID=A0A2K1INL6_PHYPA|nr:hypothetical protein PHYPA_027176 [Physcomitrium patens]
MVGLKLHANKLNKNACKSLIAAEYVGFKLETTPGFELTDTISPEYLKMNPMGKAPVLETPEGSISESNAIAHYELLLVSNTIAGLKNVGLFGSTAYEKALVDQWIDFGSLEIDTNALRWAYPPSSINNLKRALTALNAHLASRTYLVGESVTLADIVLSCNLSLPFYVAMTKEFTADYPHVERYFWTLINQPNFKKVFGKNTPKKEKVKKEKPAPAPKPAPEPETAFDDDEVAPVKKTKKALDLLPPSPMVLDNWKRFATGFWEMFDAEGWSLWFCDYKYNDENQVTFVTMNKVGGFLQRMDLARKYSFGKMFWLFRGQDVPQMVLDEVYDAELYDWTKVDITNEEQKTLVNAYFEEPDTIQGEVLREAKCFK